MSWRMASNRVRIPSSWLSIFRSSSATVTASSFRLHLDGEALDLAFLTRETP
jgi:hypothetical protein